MNLADFHELFDYTEWANELTLHAAAGLSDDQLRQDFKISHGSIFGTLLHMAGAEWIWLERWHGRSPFGPDAWAQWRPDGCADLQTLNTRWREVIERRRSYLAGLAEDLLTTVLAFRLLNGDESAMALANQMQHVVNHATLHRGQVVGMIRQLGITPPATDLLFYLRRRPA